MGYWRGYLSEAKCRLYAYGPADANGIRKPPPSLASFKSRLVLPFWYRLTQVVLEKRPLNGCSSSTLVKKILIFLVIMMSVNTRSQGCIISSYRGQHIVKAWNAFLKIPYDMWVYIKNNCWQKTT